MMESLGSVYGVPYYIVRPKIDHLPSDQAIALWNEMVRWCVEEYGPSNYNNSPGAVAFGRRWYVNNAMFWIKDQDDLIIFKLRFPKNANNLCEKIFVL